MKYFVIIFFICVLTLVKCQSKCKKYCKNMNHCEQCGKQFDNYYNKIETAQGNIQNKADKVLEKYGSIEDLENFTKLLNSSIEAGENYLIDLVTINKNLTTKNKQINSEMLIAEQLLRDLKSGHDLFLLPKIKEVEQLIDEIYNNKKNPINSDFATPERIRFIKKKLQEIAKYIPKYILNIMNIPYSVEAELDDFEHLKKLNINNCSLQFQTDLEQVLTEITGILDFDMVIENVNKLNLEASTFKNSSHETIAKKDKFLGAEKKLQDTIDLTILIVSLNDEFEKLKNSSFDYNILDDLKDGFRTSVKDQAENFGKIIEDLMRKYDNNKERGSRLLERFERIRNEDVKENMNDVESEILKITEDIDCCIQKFQNFQCDPLNEEDCECNL